VGFRAGGARTKVVRRLPAVFTRHTIRAHRVPTLVNLRAWSFDERHRVTCTLSVLNQISSAAREGFLSFRHGGMEIGGILVGSSAGTLTRIVEARPFAISHARGAQFLLTDADHEAVASFVQSTNAEVAARGLQVVGCYESRTRRDLSTSQAESEMFGMHFMAPGQVCLTLKPERETIATMLAYVRDEQGSTVPATSVEDVDESNVEPETPVAAATVAPNPDRENVRPVASEPVGTTRAVAPAKNHASRVYDRPDPHPDRPRRRWKYAAAALAVAASFASIFILQNRRNAPAPENTRPAVPSATGPATPTPNPTPPAAPERPATAAQSDSRAASELTERARAKPKSKRSKRVRQRNTTTRRTAR
jgi:hypothetical protein